ncbi:MAG: acyltransferase family protein [Actinomycetes bacterium]
MAERLSARLDDLRGAAAMLVVLGHARALSFPPFSDVSADGIGRVAVLAVYAATGLGRQAVFVFFVLSGYLILGSAAGAAVRSPTRPVRTFVSSRVARLVVVHWPAIALTLVLDAVSRATIPDRLAEVARTSAVLPEAALRAPTAAEVVGNAVFLQTVLVRPLGTNGALWSLAHEFWFYLLAAVGVALVVSARRAAIGVVLAVVLTGLVAGDMLVGLAAFLGGGVARWAATRWPPRGSVAAVALRLSLLTGGLLLAGSAVGRSDLLAMLAGLCIAVHLWALSAESLPPQVSAPRRALHWVARTSFSLYAFHLPVMVLLAAAVAPSVGSVSPGSASLLMAALVATSAGFGALGAALLERRTDLARRLLGGNYPRTVGGPDVNP